jgi:predicted RNA binding protein YcfA (HicA-like mRNA interferase family)
LTCNTICSTIISVNSRTQRLVERFVNNIDAVTLSDCITILEVFGYERRKGTGSHLVYHKKGSYPFVLPTVSGREIKKAYKIKLREFLRLEERLTEFEQ